MPSNVSELRSFLRECNYSLQFIENYSDIARPLTKLLKKKAPFQWSEEQEEAMQQLKLLCSAPCLAYPNRDKEFHLEVGLSDHCAGLFQKYDKDKRVLPMPVKLSLPQSANTWNVKTHCFAPFGPSNTSPTTSAARKSLLKRAINQ